MAGNEGKEKRVTENILMTNKSIHYYSGLLGFKDALLLNVLFHLFI